MKTGHLLAGLFLAGPAVAALSMSQIADQCADASGFATCWNTMQTDTEMCYQNFCEGSSGCDPATDVCGSSDANCASNCACVAYGQMIQCALVHCWNMVTSCQYQNLAIQAAMNCPTALSAGSSGVGTSDESPPTSETDWVYIPYFPSNSARPGACSCNIGLVYLEQRMAKSSSAACVGDSTAAVDELCYCCRDAVQVSVFYDLCPATDPAAVLADMPNFDLADYVAYADTCESAFGSDSAAGCIDHGFANPANWGGESTTLYSPSDLPANGTEKLSNGQGTISTPLYDTIVWYLGGGLATQTAVANYPVSGSSGSSGGSDGSGGTGTVVQATATAGSSIGGENATETAGSGSEIPTETGSSSGATCQHGGAWGALAVVVGAMAIPML